MFINLCFITCFSFKYFTLNILEHEYLFIVLHRAVALRALLGRPHHAHSFACLHGSNDVDIANDAEMTITVLCTGDVINCIIVCFYVDIIHSVVVEDAGKHVICEKVLIMNPMYVWRYRVNICQLVFSESNQFFLVILYVIS
jgi:hypothetical protein